ncbi:MAG: hypothetical protein P9L92_11685 [Candidatus Electryonea clarkiae]|nr:hypothetical protein [Candidatus Electryonea clarkiae]MDP8286689.1 hypothetical protein [Candidatus Electryonea clarkiae]
MGESDTKVISTEEIVSVDEITSKKQFATSGTALKIGFMLAIFLICFILSLSFFILTYHGLHIPKTPDWASTVQSDSLSVTMSLDAFERVSDLVQERTYNLLDLIFKYFVPVLMAILGYIFGIRGVEKTDREDE